jgi:hypothetical protein
MSQAHYTRTPSQDVRMLRRTCAEQSLLLAANHRQTLRVRPCAATVAAHAHAWPVHGRAVGTSGALLISTRLQVGPQQENPHFKNTVQQCFAIEEQQLLQIQTTTNGC